MAVHENTYDLISKLSVEWKKSPEKFLPKMLF